MDRREQLDEQTRHVIAHLVQRAPDDVRPGDRLVEDLALDSLDFASLLVSLEDRFGIAIQARQLRHVHTVADLQAMIGAQMDPAP